MHNKRPIYLALHRIKLPLPGIVSILHRISGVLLFLALPLLLWALHTSLQSIETFTVLMQVFNQPLNKLFFFPMLWAFLHHFCAGLRYLALDLGIGSGLANSRASSRLVLIVSLALTILIGAQLC